MTPAPLPTWLVLVALVGAAVTLAVCALEAPKAAALSHLSGLAVGWILCRVYGTAAAGRRGPRA